MSIIPVIQAEPCSTTTVQANVDALKMFREEL